MSLFFVFLKAVFVKIGSFYGRVLIRFCLKIFLVGKKLFGAFKLAPLL